MANSKQELIGEIRGLSRGRIDSRQQEVIIDEVQAHLDAAIKARLELGLSEVEAQEEAVSAFGDPLDFVTKMVLRHPSPKHSWFDRNVWKALLASTVFLSVFCVYLVKTRELLDKDLSIWIGTPVLIISLLLARWIWRASLTANRPQFLPLLVTWLMAVPLVALAWSFGGFTPEFTAAPTWSTDQQPELRLAQVQKNLDHNKLLEQQFTDAVIRHQSALPSKNPTKPVWHKSDGFEYTDSFELVPAKSSTDADAIWRRLTPKAYEIINSRKYAYGMEVGYFQSIIDRPLWLDAIYHLPPGIYVGSMWWAVMAAISLVAWFVRAFALMLKDLRRPSGGIVA